MLHRKEDTPPKKQQPKKKKQIMKYKLNKKEKNKNTCNTKSIFSAI